MKMRICFRGEIYVNGKNPQNCVDKFMDMDSDDFRKNFEFVEIASVEDAKTYKDYTDEVSF